LKERRSQLDRVLHALSHPVRRQILRELAKGAGSASTVSRALGTELGNVSYHLTQVLAKQCKVVELVDTVPRRGSVEKLYELRIESPRELAAAAEPDSRDEVRWALSLVETLLKER
jgi:DNA-binding transcriptional ArsR family regulator